MLGTKSILAAGAVIAGLLMPAQAMAQYEAYTRVDLNLRVGPDTNYGVIDVIPYGEPVNVLGCLDQFAWCDVAWYGLRGWVAADYLVQPDNTAVYLPQFAPQVGLPIISFSFDAYHDRHYRDRPWYRERRGVWRGRDYRRGDRPKFRREVREAIREEQRRDNRQERTERRQDTRQERVEERRETRQERTEQRRERRQDTRQERQEQRQQNRQERARTEQRQENRQENRRERRRAEQRQETRQQRQQQAEPRKGQRTQRRQQEDEQRRRQQAQ